MYLSFLFTINLQYFIRDSISTFDSLHFNVPSTCARVHLTFGIWMYLNQQNKNQNWLAIEIITMVIMHLKMELDWWWAAPTTPNRSFGCHFCITGDWTITLRSSGVCCQIQPTIVNRITINGHRNGDGDYDANANSNGNSTRAMSISIWAALEREREETVQST